MDDGVEPLGEPAGIERQREILLDEARRAGRRTPSDREDPVSRRAQRCDGRGPDEARRAGDEHDHAGQSSRSATVPA